MGKYDSVILPREQPYRKQTFGEAFKVGLGQTLGQLPGSILDTGFKGLSDYLVNSGLETRKTDEFNNRKKTEDTSKEWEAGTAGETEAGGAREAGLALRGTKKPIEETPADKVKSKTPLMPSKQIVGVEDMRSHISTGADRLAALLNTNKGTSKSGRVSVRTFTTDSGKTGRNAADVINQVTPGALKTSETLNRNISGSADRAGQFGNAEMGVYEKAAGNDFKRLSDYFAEVVAENPTLDPNNGNDFYKLRAMAVSRAAADKSRRSSMDLPTANKQLQDSAKNQSAVAQDLGQAERSVASTSGGIAQQAMQEQGTLDQLSWKAMQKALKGPGKIDLQRFQNAVDTRQAALELDKPNLSPEEYAAEQGKIKQMQGVIDKEYAKNPNAVAGRPEATRILTEKEKRKEDSSRLAAEAAKKLQDAVIEAANKVEADEKKAKEARLRIELASLDKEMPGPSNPKYARRLEIQDWLRKNGTLPPSN